MDFYKMYSTTLFDPYYFLKGSEDYHFLIQSSLRVRVASHLGHIVIKMMMYQLDKVVWSNVLYQRI